jgi:hypothetical protein
MNKFIKILISISMFYAISAYAGRTGLTEINSIVIKTTHIEIYTASNGNCSEVSDSWDLLPSHPNYDALVSGFLATKASGKKVDIVGRGNCVSHNEIDWAYVLK